MSPFDRTLMSPFECYTTLLNRPTTTYSVAWLAPISIPRTYLGGQEPTNLRSEDLPHSPKPGSKRCDGHGRCYLARDGSSFIALPALGTLRAGIETMKTPMTFLRLCFGAGAIGLAVWDYEPAQAADAQAPIKQTAAINHPPSALELTTRRAEAGDIEAQVALGVMLTQDESLKRDNREGARWFRRAAECGSKWGQYHLAIHYENYLCEPWTAAAWYRKAAEQGLAEAQERLGRMYAIGKGVKQDSSESSKWFQKAANQGVTAEQKKLRLNEELRVAAYQAELEGVFESCQPAE
jgi:hypothetical protein